MSISKWSDSAFYWTTKLHDKAYGCIMYNSNVKLIFHPYGSFKQLDTRDQKRLTAAAERKIALLNLTARLKGHARRTHV